MRYLIITLAVLLAACTKPLTDVDPQLPGAKKFATDGNSVIVVPMRLDDGTRCVVLTGTHGGIICDFSQQMSSIRSDELRPALTDYERKLLGK